MDPIAKNMCSAKSATMTQKERRKIVKAWQECVYNALECLSTPLTYSYCEFVVALEFRILCLEDSVISIISQSSGGYPGPV